MISASPIKVGEELDLGADVFQPSSTSVALCLCGCNGVKLVLHDQQGAPRVVAGFGMEAWVNVNRAMMKAFLDVSFPEKPERPA